MKYRMTYAPRKKRDPLPPCPACGMDSGVRKVSVTIPEQFFVICESCGFKTRPHKTAGAATQEWKKKGGASDV